MLNLDNSKNIHTVIYYKPKYDLKKALKINNKKYNCLGLLDHKVKFEENDKYIKFTFGVEDYSLLEYRERKSIGVIYSIENVFNLKENKYKIDDLLKNILTHNLKYTSNDELFRRKLKLDKHFLMY